MDPLGTADPDLEDEAALARLAARGDRRAFERLYERYFGPVLSLVRRMTGDPELARDVAQDAFSRALASVGTFDPSRRFSSWIFKIASRQVLKALKARGTWRPEVAEDARTDAARPDVVVGRAEDAEGVRAALARLPEEHRCVLLLFFQEQLSYADIAEALDISVNLARVRLFRGLRRLEKELAP